MIGLALLYFIGRAFYKLSEQYKKSKWLFAILGIASYYTGTFVGGIVLVVAYDIAGSTFIDTASDTVIGLMALPIGLLFCWGFYAILKKVWKGKPRPVSNEILDDGVNF